MKTTKETLNTMADLLEDEKLISFSMTHWLRDVIENETHNIPAQVTNVCGTAACIAGTMAMHIAPKSEEYCDDLCVAWVLEGSTDPDDYVENTLDFIFGTPQAYGKQELEHISKDWAISKLREWAALGMDWEQLNTYIEEVANENY